MDYSQSKQTTKQLTIARKKQKSQSAHNTPQNSPAATTVQIEAQYRPNHDVAPCRIGSLTTANTVNNGWEKKWENEPAAAHRRETHVSLKENRNRIPKRKIISCLTCQSLFHFSRAMFSLHNEPVNVRVFLLARTTSSQTPSHQACRV